MIIMFRLRFDKRLPIKNEVILISPLTVNYQIVVTELSDMYVFDAFDLIHSLSNISSISTSQV